MNWSSRSMNPLDWTMLDNWVFKNYLIAVEPFDKVYKFLKAVYQLIIVYVEN